MKIVRHRWIVDFLDCNGVVLGGYSVRFYTRWSAERYAASMQPSTSVATILERHRPGVPLWTTKVTKL